MSGLYIPNPAALEELEKSPEMIESLTEKAEATAQRASDLMPRGKSEARGHIADKFAVEVVDDEVRVGNTDPFFHLAEFGSINNSAFAPLRRAVMSLGFRFDEISKT